MYQCDESTKPEQNLWSTPSHSNSASATPTTQGDQLSAAVQTTLQSSKSSPLGTQSPGDSAAVADHPGAHGNRTPAAAAAAAAALMAHWACEEEHPGLARHSAAPARPWSQHTSSHLRARPPGPDKLDTHDAAFALNATSTELRRNPWAQLQQDAESRTRTKQETRNARPNNTGLPDTLKSGIESLSGRSMDEVRVHYNSSQPAQLKALAYAQGNDIHLAPGQEQHLPHEAWHVVQQREGRVQATAQMKGEALNDEPELEREADEMGRRAAQTTATHASRAAGCESKEAIGEARATHLIQRMNASNDDEGWNEVLPKPRKSKEKKAAEAQEMEARNQDREAKESGFLKKWSNKLNEDGTNQSAQAHDFEMRAKAKYKACEFDAAIDFLDAAIEEREATQDGYKNDKESDAYKQHANAISFLRRLKEDITKCFPPIQPRQGAGGQMA